MSARPAGQALVELAIIVPVLAMLLLGGAQVGQIAYTEVSVDTAAREGARAGVLAPNHALAWDLSNGGGVPNSYDCKASAGDYTPGTSGNPICVAVSQSAGLLTQGAFTGSDCQTGQACVTITVKGSNNLASVPAFSGIARLAAAYQPFPDAASTCNIGSQATVSGTVTGIPNSSAATVSDLSGDSVSVPGSGSGMFTMCVAAGGTTTNQTLTATVPGPCGGLTGSYGPFAVSPGASVTGVSIAVTASSATISGLVSPIPSGDAATITDTTGDATSTTNGSYSLCVDANVSSQTLTARVATPCGTWSGSAGPVSISPGGSYSQNITIVLQPYATVQGTVTGIPAGQTATVTATTGEEQAGVTGAYSLCVSAGASSSSETLTAQVGTPSCDGWTGSTNVSVVAGQTYTGKDIAVTAEPSCPQGGTPPPAQCTAPTISNEYSDYITVTVRYPVSIFVPFIGPLFQTSAGVRMITTSVTYAIEPCTFTKGN